MNSSCKKTKVLAITALCLFLLGCVRYFTELLPDATAVVDPPLKTVFSLPLFSDWINMAISLIPYVLLVIHFSKINNKVKMHLVLPIVFCLYALDNLHGLYVAYVSYPRSIKYSIIYAVFTVAFMLLLIASVKLKKYYSELKTLTYITVIFVIFAINNFTTSIVLLGSSNTGIINMILAATFGLAVFASLKDRNNNYFALFSLTVSFLFLVLNTALSIYSINNYVSDFHYLGLLLSTVSLIGQCCIHIALLLDVFEKKKAVS